VIEPTDEMRDAFERAHAAAAATDGFNFREDAEIQLDAGLAAVLAIVEREYRIEPRPPWERPDGHLKRNADEHHYDVSCDDRPHCRIPEHHEAGVL
jgi:hypothetical protein